jgi:hypothetical protein
MFVISGSSVHVCAKRALVGGAQLRQLTVFLPPAGASLLVRFVVQNVAQWEQYFGPPQL